MSRRAKLKGGPGVGSSEALDVSPGGMGTFLEGAGRQRLTFVQNFLRWQKEVEMRPRNILYANIRSSYLPIINIGLLFQNF